MLRARPTCPSALPSLNPIPVTRGYWWCENPSLISSSIGLALPRPTPFHSCLLFYQPFLPIWPPFSRKQTTLYPCLLTLLLLSSNNISLMIACPQQPLDMAPLSPICRVRKRSWLVLYPPIPITLQDHLPFLLHKSRTIIPPLSNGCKDDMN